MKENFVKRASCFLAFMLACTAFAGCSQKENHTSQASNRTASSVVTSTTANITASTASTSSEPVSSLEDGSSTSETGTPSASNTTLNVRFGDNGAAFTMYLYDNDTAAAIARHVGTADWRLPIYDYDNFENWEVMQYYDIPSRYEIPSAPENITEEAAGTVYYSEPNRIVLFYHEAQVPGEYTPVGYFEYTDTIVIAVENNPVLEGWGNKIIQISSN